MNFPSSQMNPMVSADGPKYGGDTVSIEAKYAEVLDDAFNGKHSENADNCDLQNQVAQLVAIEMKSHKDIFSLDSDNAIFTRIGLQVARLVDRELSQCAKYYAGLQ